MRNPLIILNTLLAPCQQTAKAITQAVRLHPRALLRRVRLYPVCRPGLLPRSFQAEDLIAGQYAGRLAVILVFIQAQVLNAADRLLRAWRNGDGKCRKRALLYRGLPGEPVTSPLSGTFVKAAFIACCLPLMAYESRRQRWI